MTKEAFEGVIAALEASSKGAAANPQLYNDGWECAMQCAANIVKEHAKAWQNHPSYIMGWNDALKELETAIETIIKRNSSRL